MVIVKSQAKEKGSVSISVIKLHDNALITYCQKIINGKGEDNKR